MDQIEISNMLTDEDFNKSLTQYSSSEMLFINDNNNNSYNSGQIRVDSLQCQQQFVVWSESYLSIPLQIQCVAGGTAYTTSEILALKQSVLNLISGILVTSGSGQTIVSDSNIGLINNIRLLLERSWDTEFGCQDLQFFKDTNLQPYTTRVGAYNAGASHTVTNDPYPFQAAFAGPNSTYNEGFSNRVRFLKANSTFAGGVFSTIAYIPLRYIHQLFAKLDFPIINQRFQFTFYTPITNSTAQIAQNAPFMHNATSAPQVSIGNATQSSVRLYYKRVVFSPELNTKIASKLQAGFTKTLSFNVTDVYNPRNNVNTATSYNDLVSPSCVLPRRLFILFVPTGAINSQTLPISFPAELTNLNAFVNGTLFYQNDLVTDMDAWNVIKDQLSNRTSEDIFQSAITYQDFIGPYRLYCIDFSRLGSAQLKAPNEAVSIQCKFTRNDTVACDQYYLLEREVVTKWNFSANDCKITIGAV